MAVAVAAAGKDLPVQVGFDRKAKCPFAHPVPYKGLRDSTGVESLYRVKCLVGYLNKLGYKKVNVKSDQESSILFGLLSNKQSQGDTARRNHYRKDSEGRESFGWRS